MLQNKLHVFIIRFTVDQEATVYPTLSLSLTDSVIC